ncbi:uncharacterized protein B0H18DRAFT_1212267 [Fomitopsis serialis]|uniref:uncharacterized protein n=1 Tax=Fomitopsis serialis TaxID=139415 RepID=UPI002008E367|nr:uncharacterized protein B0H18DRAFT_1212267 [Neoantrodia serialis]KAH9923350.1 hypothetical protein B0H18DRAFT_1212267 [Neoantrodia serialis]
MLVGKVPYLSQITIRDVEWTIGSVRTEDISYLAAFSAIHTLHIVGVILSSASQLSQLISALPGLRHLRCVNVSSSQAPEVLSARLPLNSADLEVIDVRWVAPAVEDLFDNVLGRLDSILQEKRFFSSVAPCGVCLGFYHQNSTWRSCAELQIGTDTRLQEQSDRWDELVRRKMPLSHERGVLVTMYDMEDFRGWMQDMDRICTGAPAEQTNVEGEAQPDDQDDEPGPLGDMD